MKSKQFVLCLTVILALFSSINVIPNSANPDLDLTTLSDEVTLDSQNVSVNDRNYLLGVENDPTDSDSLELAVRFNEYAEDNEPNQVDTGRWNYTDEILNWYEWPDSRSMEESYNPAANRSVRMAEEGYLRLTHADLLAGAGGENYFNNTHTIGLWVRPHSFYGGGSGTYGTSIERIVNKIGYYNIRIRGEGAIPFVSIEYVVDGLGQLNSSLIGDGSWSNVVCKQAGSKMYIYLNGSLDVSYDFGGSATYGNEYPFYWAGYTFAQSPKTWHDDYFFWSKNLSDSSIANLYNIAPDYAYNQTVSSTVSGNWTGFLTNDTAQVNYNLNYTIANATGTHEKSLEVMDWSMHNHTFYYYNNYTFVNVTFGNGTFKTVESGFSISVENATHNRIDFTETVAGAFSWYFLTGNAITNLIINPDESNGTLDNVSSVQFNIRIANGSQGIVGSPISVQVLLPDETVLSSVSSSTGANGWYNSSISQSFLHSSDNTYFIVATGLNDTFLGFMIKRFYAYNDWDAPVVTNILYEDTLIEDVSFSLDVSISDDLTEFADLTVTMDYSFVSSGTLTESSVLTISGAFYTVSLVGQAAGTTLWFQITVIDNLSNSFESMVYQTDWEVAEEVAPSGGGDGDGDGVTPAAVTAAGGIPDVVLILLFGAGAVSVAVVGYAVLQRVQVRTRTVKTQEVVTGLGTFGRAGEKIKVTGRKPKGRSKKAIKKARDKRKRK